LENNELFVGSKALSSDTEIILHDILNNSLQGTFVLKRLVETLYVGYSKALVLSARRSTEEKQQKIIY
jgi:hypothetical protein